ncbi:hypothetical protein E9993_19515 [Labilibacter sediminis]|nr:hypothetical protein E9993_19515 [Labilibacter sediminis]
MIKYLFVVVFISLLAPQVLSGQFYLSGSDPASIKWNKIETTNFRVVFSDEFTEKAQYIAKVLEEVYKYGGNSLNHKPKKIDVLVHSETSYSNGFVTWAPKRIELYAAPNQTMHATEWLQQLAIHEFRHVVQIDKLNTGLTRMLSYILGEQAVGGVLGLYVPMWFLEGDAVAAETALTPAGRGRSPWFEQGMRAQIMDKELYSYEKASFGSYKHYVPNHYEMGYQLVAGARSRYGPEIWEHALLNSGRNSHTIIPFNNGQMKVSKIDKSSLYKSTFYYLHEEWIKQDSKTEKTDYTPITSINTSYLNFQYPVSIGDGKYIAQLSGPGEIQRFVEVDGAGNYKTLFIPGYRSDEPFSYSDNTICWAETEPDPRWENRAYSVIKCYDISSGKVRKITKKSRYFSPAISPDGKKIIAVSANNINHYRLVLIDKESGELIEEFEHGNNDYLLTPSWNKEGNAVVCVALSGQGKALVQYNLNTREWSSITDYSYADISLPKWRNKDEVIYTSIHSGTDEIYSANVHTGAITKLTQTKYGATGANLISGGEEIVYSRYSADGYQLVKTDANSFANEPLVKVKDHSLKLHQKIASQEQGVPDFSNISDMPDYEVKKYSKWNLFNFHSWAPAFINVNDAEVNWGASAVSQNLLGTAVTALGLNLDPQMSNEKYYFNFKYTGWYPVLEFEIKHGSDQLVYEGYYEDDNGIFSLETEKYSLTQIELGANLPLNLTRGKYSTLLQPSVNYFMQHRTAFDTDRLNYVLDGRDLVYVDSELFATQPKYAYNGLEYSLYFHHLLKRSSRDVTTRWGQLLELKYQNTPWGTINAGSITGVRTRFYFPGIFKHHSIRIDNNYQYKVKGDEYAGDSIYVNNYKFSDMFTLPRGYDRDNNDQLYSFKGDYIFPLWNPDVTVPGLVYLKRITSNLFFDYSRSSEEITFENSMDSFTRVNNYKSFGAEFRGEVHVFRFLYPITVGYRYARLVNYNKNKHEFLLGLNISGFSLGKQ